MSEAGHAPAKPSRAVLVMRRSPDWRALASDFAAGRAIDPQRFQRDATLPGIPDDLVDLIDLWNRSFAMDFFTCRSRLKDIAERNLAAVSGVVRTDVSHWRDCGLDPRSDILFFHDDDDWFAPDLARGVSRLDAARFDVCVFATVRIWSDARTFIWPGAPAPAALGPVQPFMSRYHTNNYGLVARLADERVFGAMLEHMPAGEFAKAHGFRDVYINRTLSVTVKTPCSAGVLRELRARLDDPRGWVGKYAETLAKLAIPESLSWLRSGVSEIENLFAEVARAA